MEPMMMQISHEKIRTNIETVFIQDCRSDNNKIAYIRNARYSKQKKNYFPNKNII